MFKSKVVIVTGSSTGIGAGTAVKFASEGASGIVLHGRQEEGLKNVKERCEKAGQGNLKVHVCVGDITQENVRQKLINETIKEFGQLDILINNAGISMRGTVSELPIDAYDKVFDVNVRALVAVTQLAIPHLIKSSGNIINISSGAAVKALPIFTYYCMSKAALDHFTRCLAVELGPKGVRVNSVNPGFIPGTEIVTRQGVTVDQIKVHTDRAVQLYLLRRVGTIDEVADAILYFASDKAKFITGVVVPVDGGAVQA
jgi:NAD(P)-dependent dehydrogenase (short-subunit alcohol dehydrogenase family)